MAISYFTADGNYGSDEFLQIETEHWTGEMWERISETSDYDRIDLARHFDNADHDFTLKERYPETGLFCSVCELSAEELGE
jgi:hypothetical protein